MKKKFIAAAAILLALSLLAGCGVPQELGRGTITDNVYTNESIGLTFTAPGGWEYISDEKIAEILGQGAEAAGASKSDASSEAFNKVNTYDMIAVDTATNASVMVTYQRLVLLNGETRMDEEAVLNSFKDNMSKSQSYKCIFTFCPDAEIGSNSYKVMSAEYEDSGITQYFYVRQESSYTLCIIVTIPGGADLDSVMANFS